MMGCYEMVMLLCHVVLLFIVGVVPPPIQVSSIFRFLFEYTRTGERGVSLQAGRERARLSLLQDQATRARGVFVVVVVVLTDAQCNTVLQTDLIQKFVRKLPVFDFCEFEKNQNFWQT